MDSDGACIVNIGPRERRLRLAMGLSLLGVVVAMTAVLMLADSGRWWRLALLPPLWGAALGTFQAREKT
jgi:hypothetical protein